MPPIIKGTPKRASPCETKRTTSAGTPANLPDDRIGGRAVGVMEPARAARATEYDGNKTRSASSRHTDSASSRPRRDCVSNRNS